MRFLNSMETQLAQERKYWFYRDTVNPILYSLGRRNLCYIKSSPAADPLLALYDDLSNGKINLSP